MKTATSCSMWCSARRKPASCRSPSAAACAPSKTSARCSLPAPTRYRSIPPRWRGAVLSKRLRKNSATNASWSRSTPRKYRSRRKRTAGKSSPMADATRPASMRWLTRAKWSRSAPAKSCSRRWIATEPGQGFDIALTRAIADARHRPGHRLGRRRHARTPGRRHSRRPCQCSARRLDFSFRRALGARGQGLHGARRLADAARSLSPGSWQTG